MSCAKCKVKSCYFSGEILESCPLSEQLLKEAVKEYLKPLISRIYLAAAEVEKRAYSQNKHGLKPVKPRVLELMEFLKICGFKKVGIAFCIGLSSEAERLTKVLEENGFEVFSVVCKCGGVDKEELEIPEEFKLRGGRETACNPILQAKILNEYGTDVNIIVGLCIGHDMLFTMYSRAPVTTFIVKDRLTGHNPAVALYSSYYKNYLKL